jgi:hypothetical protein
MTDAINSHSRRMYNTQRKTRADLATPLDDPRVKALVEAANGVVNEYYNQVHGPIIYNIKQLDAALEAIASPSISALEENK